MIDEKKIFESKEEIVKIDDSLNKEIYKKAVEQSKNKRYFWKNKKLYITFIVVIILMVTPFIFLAKEPQNIEDPDDGEDIVGSQQDNWNNIKFASTKKLSLKEAVFSVKNNSEENVSENEQKTVFDNIDTVMVVNNENGEKWFTNNNEIIIEILGFADLSYRRLAVVGEEILMYISLLQSGYTVTYALNNGNVVNFTFLATGEVLLSDNGYCISTQTIDYQRVLITINEIIENNDSYTANEEYIIDINSVDVSNSDMNSILGYSNIDRTDYSTVNKKYHFNYLINVNFSSDKLIKNKFNGKSFLPGTNIAFDSDDEYYLFLSEKLGFTELPNFSCRLSEGATFDIGELTKEKEEWLLKILSLEEVDFIRIEDNHYFEVEITEIKYLVTEGYIKERYLFIDSCEKIKEFFIINELYVEDVSVFDKYDEEFFKTHFLYVTDKKYNINYATGVQFDVVQNGTNVVYEEYGIKPETGSDITNYMICIEVEKQPNISFQDYTFNGERLIFEKVELNIKSYWGDEVLTYYKGDTVKLKDLNYLFEDVRAVGLCYNDKFLDVFDTFIINKDTTVYMLGEWGATVENTGVVRCRLYIINVDDSSLNKWITMSEKEHFSKSILEEKLGYGIEEVYADCKLTDVYSFNKAYCHDSMSLWVKPALEEKVIRYEFNEKTDSVIYAYEGEKYGVNSLVGDKFMDYRYNIVYNSIDTFKKDFQSITKDTWKEEDYSNGIGIMIRRSAYNDTMVMASYELKYIAIHGLDVVIALQKTYPNYKRKISDTVLCYDFLTLDLGDLYNEIKDKRLTLAIDDAYFNDDYYANMELKDLEKLVFDADVFYDKISYSKNLDWYDITAIYEQNLDKFIYSKGLSGVIENYDSYGVLDVDKIDKSFFEKIIGYDFDYDANYLLIIDRYSYYSQPHIGSYEIESYIDRVAIYAHRKDDSDIINSEEKKMTHYVELIVAPKSIMNWKDKLKITYSSGGFYGVRTTTYTLNGKKYGVNDLMKDYESTYKLGEPDYYHIIEGKEEKGYNEYIRDLLGYFPNRLYKAGFNSSNPWIYIERTANYEGMINARYELINWDTKTHELTLKRTYDLDKGKYNPTVCYDMIEIRHSYLFDIHKIPNDFKIIIIEE